MRGRARLEGAGVRFQIDRHGRLVSPSLARLRRGVRENWGLRGMSVELGPGEGVALIGPSGSGKTTLLQLLAGVMPADEGSVTVSGRIGSLLSVGSGLTMQLTGRENVRLLGVLAGLSQAEAVGRTEDIKEASGLGVAFERPAATWSQGMKARLGWAVATVAQPDVVLLDEVHEALDHEFRAVVEAYATDLMADGGLVVAAGHDHHLLGDLCRRALWLSDGEIRRDGPFGDVVAAYAA